MAADLFGRLCVSEGARPIARRDAQGGDGRLSRRSARRRESGGDRPRADAPCPWPIAVGRSEEHTSELQSLMRISYAVFCLTKKKKEYTHLDHDYAFYYISSTHQ